MAKIPKKKPIRKVLPKPAPQEAPNHNDKLLEHILVNQNDHHDLAQKQRETQIIQHDQHKQEDHQADAVKIELHGKTNEKLDGVQKAIENIAPEIKKTASAHEFITNFLTSIKGDKGDQGEKGGMPQKGVDYFTPEELQTIADDVRKLIPTPKDGTTPQKGVDYFTDAEIKDVIAGVVSAIHVPQDGKDGKDGRDGKDAVVNYQNIIKEVVRMLPVISNGKDGKDGTSDTGEEILAKLRALPEGKGLKYGDIKDAPQFRGTAPATKMGGTGYLREITDVAISNPTNGQVLTYNSTTKKWENAAGGGGGGMTDPMTTRGDIIVRDATNTTNRLAIGTSGKVLRSDGTDISWAALTTASVAASTNKNYVTDTQLTAVAALATMSTQNASAVAITGGTITGTRKQPRAFSTASTASLTPEIDSYDVFHVTALAAAITINNHSTSTPADGEQMRIRLLDNGTARAITFGNAYVAKGGVALPTTTVLSKNMEMIFEWNANLSKWNLLSIAQEV